MLLLLFVLEVVENPCYLCALSWEFRNLSLEIRNQHLFAFFKLSNSINNNDNKNIWLPQSLYSSAPTWSFKSLTSVYTLFLMSTVDDLINCFTTICQWLSASKPFKAVDFQLSALIRLDEPSLNSSVSLTVYASSF